MDKSNYLFLLDPGHGGIIDGIYQTEGKRSPVWDDGSILYEGVFTRDVVRRIVEMAPQFGVHCINLVPEQTDVSLKERVSRANESRSFHRGMDCIYVSIHANAGGGHGIEVFTSPGLTRSDAIATVFLKRLNLAFPTVRLRTDMSDGDPDKEANFYVLRKTLMPAVLTENFFMDNEKECKEYLMSKSGRDKIARAHLSAMAEIERSANDG